MRILSCSILLVLLLGCVSGPESPWIMGFEKPAQNPILKADSSYVFFDPNTQTEVRWQKADVFNPAAVVRNDTVFLFYRAEDNPKAYLGGRTSRIGLAWSTDGMNFTKHPEPVLYPDSTLHVQWDYPGGCEDPRVVETEEGNYVMTYTSWDQKTARLSIASSNNLIDWHKEGPAFEFADNPDFMHAWSKSGSIVCRQEGSKLIATKINGKYWMYFGERGAKLAWSDDLLDWNPLENEQGEMRVVMPTRTGKFDSFLTEPGPPALITDAGILLIYNGKNDEGELADPNIAKGTYCGGQALFDLNDPSKLITRMDQPFICPDLPHEVTGQYKAGTTFLEGLVLFRNKWHLYYGTADSYVGIAVQQ